MAYWVLIAVTTTVLAVGIAYFVPLNAKDKAVQRLPEPPIIRSYTPFIGHAIGMIRKGASYFEYVNKKNHPIFTLPILTSRNYVVTNAGLAGLIQRNGKTLSFYSLIGEVTRRLIALDKHAAHIMFHNVNGPDGLMARVHEMVNRHLGPGSLLDAITTTQILAMSKFLSQTVPADGLTVNLYTWQRGIFSLCNMTAIYGPDNIFAVDPTLETAFWDFEEGILGLVVDILPWLTTRKAFQARKKVLEGLVRYVKEKRYKSASPFINERIETNLEWSMSEQMCGNSELILMFGILGNAVPSSFWLICNLFSRQNLLAEVREEIESVVERLPSGGKGESTTQRIAISAKRISMRSCPLLYSCYRETLREVSLLTSARLVLEDTILADKYLLRKGSVVQIAGGVLGRDSSIWGADGREFNPYRFLRTGESADGRSSAAPMPEGVPSAAFRAFGGGTVICPGRHFALTELMVFAANLVLAFDITEVNGAPLKLPSKDETRIPLSVMKPVSEPMAKIKQRAGWEHVVVDLHP